MYSIQNRQKRAWSVPPVHGKDNQMSFKPVTINPGETIFVHEEHWDAVKKGNKAIDALLVGRHLVVTTSGRTAGPADEDELKNPKSPTAPAELKTDDDRVTLEKKTEVKTITLDDDEPRSGKGLKQK